MTCRTRQSMPRSGPPWDLSQMVATQFPSESSVPPNRPRPAQDFRMARCVFATLICLSALVPSSRAQSGGMIPVYEMMNGGAGGADAAFQQVEFAQLKLQQDNQKAAQAEA